MHFWITGVNHKTLPLVLREKLYFSPEQCSLLLDEFVEERLAVEALILSTCNRTEVYFLSHDKSSFELAQAKLCEHASLNFSNIENAWYHFEEEAALSHLFKVASGLDSLVLGESQIFAQLKSAYQLAHQKECTSRYFNYMLHRAFSTTKRIRTETGIGLGCTSIPSVAIELLEENICTRKPPRLLVIGTGKMGHLTAKNYVSRELGELVVMNRTPEKAEKTAAELGAKVALWENLADELAKADGVITCSSSERAIISSDLLIKVLKDRNLLPLTLVDLGVPRNVEPSSNAIEGVHLYNIDDLQDIAERNKSERKKEASQALDIAKAEAKNTYNELSKASVEPTIAELIQKYEELRNRELSKALDQLSSLDKTQKSVIENCTVSIVNKILHDPILSLKDKKLDESCRLELSDTLRQLFQLDRSS